MHELSDAWEQSTTGVTIRVAGLTNLVIEGPNGPNIDTTDTTESYFWTPGDDYTSGAILYTDTNGAAAGLEQWVTDFKAAYVADNTLRATLVLNDGQGPAVITVDAAATVTAGTPTVTASASASVVADRDAAASITAGTPTVTASAAAVSAPEADAAAAIIAGTPAVTATAEAVAGDYADASAVVIAGVPAVTASAGAQDINIDVAATVTAGDPTVTASAAAAIVTNADAAATITAGTPTITTTADTTTGGTVPGAPTMLDATDITETSLLLTWQEGTNDGLPIIGYQVRIGTGNWASTGSITTTYRVEGLQAGTAILITVRAVNGLGPGAASAPLALTTLRIVSPDAPRFVTAAQTGQRSGDLSWEPPVSDGGSPITGYEVCVIPPFGDAEPFEAASSTTGHRVRGLAFGHRYGFQVRAVNAAGGGAQSPLVYLTPAEVVTVLVPVGFHIPLIDTDRQSLIVRLGAVDCRVLVRWQPTRRVVVCVAGSSGRDAGRVRTPVGGQRGAVGGTARSARRGCGVPGC